MIVDPVTFAEVQRTHAINLAALNVVGKPLRTTTYTNGAGIHTILPTSKYQIVTLQAAGANGAPGSVVVQSSGGGGGGGGAKVDERVAFTGNIGYQVGAPGASGGSTVFGTLRAPGGAPATAGTSGSSVPGGIGASNTKTHATDYLSASMTPGGGGGNGGASANSGISPGSNGGGGSAAGHHAAGLSNGTSKGGAAGGGTYGGGGGGGGGDSVYGKGGDGGAHGAAGRDGDGFGSGGGGGGGGGGVPGLGKSGFITVEEY